MPQPSGTHSTYDHVGRREDLKDIIYDVTPTETPFLSAIPRGKAMSTKHEWLTRSLAAASGSNANIEGDDATNDSANANVRLDNQTQILDKVAQVTRTQQSVRNAGMPNTMAREMADKMKEIKRDLETSLLQNVAKVVGNDTAARVMAGLQTYVKTNIDKASDATAAAGTGADIHTDGTPRALTETMVEAALALAWTNGGNPSMGILNAFQKRKAASFSGSSTKMSDGDKRKVTNNVEVYIDPLGTEIRLVPCRQCPTDVIYFVDTDFLELSVLDDFSSHDLAKTGDSVRKQIVGEMTLEVSNEKAHAAVYDLTAS